MKPSYLALGIVEIEDRKSRLINLLDRCKLCPLRCGVDRLNGEHGVCQTGRSAFVSSFGPHLGEEAVLVGQNGSGTVFFAGCNLRCHFCQNYEISQLRIGKEVEKEELALLMLRLKKMGCHNINLVSPTHIIPQVVEALPIAVEGGLDLPIVYNSGGYDSVETLKILEGLVDIYMPDAKYGDDEIAKDLSGIDDYWQVNQAALLEMHRQVGDLVVEKGIARRGMIIRHLVLPSGLARSEIVLKFIAESLSKDSYVNIMDQYHPAYLAFEDRRIAQRVTDREYRAVIDYARSVGLKSV